MEETFFKSIEKAVDATESKVDSVENKIKTVEKEMMDLIEMQMATLKLLQENFVKHKPVVLLRTSSSKTKIPMKPPPEPKKRPESQPPSPPKDSMMKMENGSVGSPKKIVKIKVVKHTKRLSISVGGPVDHK